MTKFLVFICLFACYFTSSAQSSIDSIVNKKYPGLKGSFKISHQHISKISGIRHTYLVQTYEGAEILNSIMSLHQKRNGEMIKSNDGLHPEVLKYQPASKSYMTLERAVSKYASLKDIVIHSKTIIKNGDERSLDKIVFENPSLSNEDITAKKAWMIKEGRLTPVWNFVGFFNSILLDTRINAATGELIEELVLTSNCGFDHNATQHAETCFWDSKESTDTQANSKRNSIEENNAVVNSMAPQYNVFPIPIESPIYGTRSEIVDPSTANASPFGWHDTDGVSGAEYTTTKGNNAEVKDDQLADNEFTAGQFADGGTNLDFDFPFIESNASQNFNASATNLFYWNNIIHDITYEYGFDEVAGNYQANNYGKGGLGNDHVYVDGLDGIGFNNANFSPGIDGQNGRMQMFRWVVGTTSSINSPLSIQQNLSTIGRASFGATTYDIIDTIVLTDPILGCSSIINTSALAGKIALIDRGDCHLSAKVYNAQLAGAIGVIICQNTIDPPVNMPGGDNANLVTIPAIMLSQALCNSIKTEINNGNVVVSTLRYKQFDSGFDNGVIVHEYAHGISNRLTGGAANSGCLSNQEQMGEGWSDWFALMLTMKPGDNAATPRGIGNYLLGQGPNGQGIRTLKYTTDMNINPGTYDNIKTLSIPHGVGNVWATMLWDLSWAFIDKYGISTNLYSGNAGNNRVMKIVMEAMKLQPCSPGFVDARDAILLADEILYNGENQAMIWKVFARRGLGFSAQQGSVFSRADGVQKFDVPPAYNDLQMTVVANQSVASINDSIVYTIKVKNNSNTTISSIDLKDTLSNDHMVLSLSNGGTFVDTIISFPTFSLAAGDSTTRLVYTKVISNVVNLPTIIDSAGSGQNIFIPSITNSAYGPFIKTSSSPYDGTPHWFVKDDSVGVDKFLTLKNAVQLTSKSKFSFWHKFNTEPTWDGGQIQISFDNKLTWQNLTSQITQGFYNSYIDEDPSMPAFSGLAANYFNTIVDLGVFAGKIAHLRFYMHCDPFTGGDGWYIDDIVLSDCRDVASLLTCQSSSLVNNSYCLNNGIKLIDCKEVYSKTDAVQGSLRRAINCANNNDTITIAEGMILDTSLIDNNAIIIDKNLTIKGIDTWTLDATHGMSVIHIKPNANVIFENLKVLQPTTSTGPAILNEGNLTIKNVMVKKE